MMRILANTHIKKLFFGVAAAGACWSALIQIMIFVELRRLSGAAFAVSVLSLAGIFALMYGYFKKQDEQLENAAKTIDRALSGDVEARIESDEEGALFRLFHAVNTLSQVLYVRASKETDEKAFLKDTISDISHQLKTPIAALNVYNGILQQEAENNPAISEFVLLSEKELDRIGTLVQNLLKITRMDAGTLTFCRRPENISDMMKDIMLRFSCRAKQEGKEIILSGSDGDVLECDREWLSEAIENLVKNALDHTEKGDSVTLRWRQYSSSVRIEVSDTGCGIHPEDIHHIFKRFYRSRYSSDKQGTGLGLPLAKAIVEGHRGTIEVESLPGQGSMFCLNFLTYKA